jgi:hypothetical protein
MKALLALATAWIAAFGASSAQSDANDVRSAVISLSSRPYCMFSPSPGESSCLHYDLTISGIGTVKYGIDGRGLTNQAALRTHRVDAERVRHLINDFLRADFFGLKDEYSSIDLGNGLDQTQSELGWTTISISIGGKTKTVRAKYGAPAVVWYLARRIDEVGDSRRYTKQPFESGAR